MTKATLVTGIGIDTRLPYLDHEWLEEVLSLPPEARVANRVQVDLIERFSPELLEVPFHKPLRRVDAQSRL